MTSPHSAHSTTSIFSSVEDRPAVAAKLGAGRRMKRLAYYRIDTLSKTACKHEEGGAQL